MKFHIGSVPPRGPAHTMKTHDSPGPWSSFITTQWSVVVAAADKSTPESRQALARLCQTYWRPLYAYVRRRGYSVDDAQDLTQGFFARLLEKDYLADVRRERGRFRTFLLASLKHYMANERDRAQAEKRGGGRLPLSLDMTDAEGNYLIEAVDHTTPDVVYEQRWAMTIIGDVLAELRAEFEGEGKGERFERLASFLTGEQMRGEYRQAATQLGMSESAVKVAVHRLRARFREMLRRRIAQTVASPDLVDDEIQLLFSAFANR